MTYQGNTPEYAKHEKMLPLRAGEEGVGSLWSVRRRLFPLSNGAGGRVADGRTAEIIRRTE
ncbi:MAG: hypothetical protein AVDCRST_MAG43-1732 [uncultured Thermomicrobiales bacterium]|uniref:Uncharacterized protein n=1 Tax=uncultured Thermomicrobiales bacterium TaxID=1645740 RepID=A0A6J4US01_9BACT|nr:MAG: hypothetical protein AVDCRST_MAG43-1732 [uncultured Thermomicrobiales bacterium]